MKINYITYTYISILYRCFHPNIDRQQPSERTTFRQIGSALLCHSAYCSRTGHLRRGKRLTSGAMTAANGWTAR